MKYTHIFIDADDTVFDYGAAEKISLEKTLIRSGAGEKPGLVERASEEYRKINSGLWMEFEKGTITLDFLRTERFRKVLEFCGMDSSEKICREVSGFYLELLGSSGYLLDGAAEMLEKLSGKCSLVMITNGISPVQRGRIEASGTGRYFSAVVISEEIGYKKPEKEYFDAAMTAAGNPEKDKVLVVGDSLTSDILGGNNYGLDTCWFNPERRENTSGIIPRFEISSLDMLYTLVV